MSAVAVPIPFAGMRPRLLARYAGVLDLFTILTGILAQGIISARLVVPGDAATTATNILAHRSLFQVGFAVYLIEMASQVAVTALFYGLLKPAGRNLSFVVACIGLAGCVVKTFARVFFIAPLFVLDGPSYLSSFSTAQLHALAHLFLKVNDQGAGIALVFFGFSALLKGILVLRSTFLPHFLSVLSMVVGASLLSFLYPPLGHRLFSYIAIVGLIGSVGWIFWLLVFGVNEERWREQAAS